MYFFHRYPSLPCSLILLLWPDKTYVKSIQSLLYIQMCSIDRIGYPPPLVTISLTITKNRRFETSFNGSIISRLMNQPRQFIVRIAGIFHENPHLSSLPGVPINLTSPIERATTEEIVSSFSTFRRESRLQESGTVIRNKKKLGVAVKKFGARAS